ncbi:CotH kinase family protein [Aquimarina latercula]|uniref:CotH kinase family protein n=1 Tax=Aquimarina latercula TaxID=987 RepID=UPI00042A789E|nr:CotH kinase family protein [Aquimarina latercula]
MFKLYTTCVLLFSCLSLVCAQETTTIIAKKGSFGIDKKNKIIVWNFKVNDSTKQVHKAYTQIIFDKDCKRTVLTDSLSYKNRFSIDHNNETYTLYISKLPIVSIRIKDSITDIPKKPSKFQYASNKKNIDTLAGIELRGNLSLTFPKKSYDLEFWKDASTKVPFRIKLPKLGTNDDWILDGLYNEPLRLRSYVGLKLWLSIHKSHYTDKEPKAKSGADLRFVEVFLNSEYQGLYVLSQQVDRDLLKLKRFENNVIKGELFKATSYEGAPAYKKVPPFKNLFPHWGGYQMKYPVIDYKGHWDDLHSFTDFVINSSSADFNNGIEKRFDIPNAIDYFLLVNLLRATDNLGKNMFVARYDQNTPYFNVPWDLDGVLGTIQDGKRIPTTDDILSNGLFDRLLAENPAEYKSKLKYRWTELRKNQFSTDSLLATINQTYKRLKKNKIYERENLVWPSKISYKDHLEYIREWLIKRLAYLDTYFNDLK